MRLKAISRNCLMMELIEAIVHPFPEWDSDLLFLSKETMTQIFWFNLPLSASYLSGQVNAHD